jgi:hypothetical protein
VVQNALPTTTTHSALPPKLSTSTSQLSSAAAPAVAAPNASSLMPSLPPRPFTLPRGKSYSGSKGELTHMTSSSVGPVNRASDHCSCNPCNMLVTF